jgi:hypothetical protein
MSFFWENVSENFLIKLFVDSFNVKIDLSGGENCKITLSFIGIDFCLIGNETFVEVAVEMLNDISVLMSSCLLGACDCLIELISLVITSPHISLWKLKFKKNNLKL